MMTIRLEEYLQMVFNGLECIVKRRFISRTDSQVKWTRRLRRGLLSNRCPLDANQITHPSNLSLFLRGVRSYGTLYLPVGVATQIRSGTSRRFALRFSQTVEMWRTHSQGAMLHILQGRRILYLLENYGKEINEELVGQDVLPLLRAAAHDVQLAPSLGEANRR